MTSEEVQRLAELARLSLDADEVAGLAAHLGRILDNIDALDVEQGATVDATNAAAEDVDYPALRADEPVIQRRPMELDAMAPGWVAGFFTVPRSAQGPPGDGA